MTTTPALAEAGAFAGTAWDDLCAARRGVTACETTRDALVEAYNAIIGHASEAVAVRLAQLLETAQDELDEARFAANLALRAWMNAECGVTAAIATGS